MVLRRADFSSPRLVRLVARPVGHSLERGDGPLSGDAEGPQGILKHNGGEQVVAVLRHILVFRARMCTSLRQAIVRHVHSGDLFVIANMHATAGKPSRAEVQITVHG